MIILFAVAAASDYFDGFFARREGPTKFGKVWDSFCDKFFFLSLALFFLSKGDINIFQFIVLLLKDFYVLALIIMTGIMSLYDKRVLALKGLLNARWPGKITSVIVFLCLGYVILGLPAFEYVIFVPLISAVIAIIDYTVVFGSKISEVL